jgi:hypothetical protein
MQLSASVVPSFGLRAARAIPRSRLQSLLIPRSSGAVEAVSLSMRTYLSDLAAVPYQKTAGTGEFVGLTWQYPDGQFFMGKVCARKLECFRRLGLVFVYLSGVLIVTASLQLFDAVFVQFFFGLARGVVIGRHLCLPGLEKPRS